MDTGYKRNPLHAVIFDFGGVLAEEGFSLGLRAIGRDNGLDPERTFETGRRLVHETGYLTGKEPEEAFWEAFRRETGIALPDDALRKEILQRFVIRPWMLEHVQSLRATGFLTAILSDQTNWLDELNRRNPFYGFFDMVQNSYDCGMSKFENTAYQSLLDRLKVEPGETLFVDDTFEHVRRARSLGIGAIHYIGRTTFEEALRGHTGGIMRTP
ncbi:MAG: HAD family hydrolase [Thermovirgaceae bacterium]